MKRQYLVIIFTVFIILLTIPTVYAWMTAGNAHIFGGILSNPIDGQSYLAKMKEGWNGQWLFRLPYTANPGQGQPLFLFYIFLGALSSWIHIPVTFTFQISRLLSAALLFFSLYQLIKKTINIRYQIWALLLLVFGSGMGWLLLFAGLLPIDFYVAEAYPFLASYTNPHFPTGISLLIWLFILSLENPRLKEVGLIFVSGILLSVILPFGIVIYSASYVLLAFGELKDKKIFNFAPLLAVLCGGGIFLLYQFFIIRTDPVLSIWDAQNITPAPDIFSLLVGLLPLIAVAFLGFKIYFKSDLTPIKKLMVLWVVVSLILTFMPFNLQRRFLTALYIPVVIVAVLVIEEWQTSRHKKSMVFYSLTAASVLSNILIIVMGVSACMQKDKPLYISRTEEQTLVWIKENSDVEDIVMAPPALSLFIPNISERRVVYGHPFETVNAEQQKLKVERFYSGALKSQELATFIQENRIRYIILDSQSSQINLQYQTDLWSKVYDQGGIVVYKTQ